MERRCNYAEYLGEWDTYEGPCAGRRHYALGMCGMHWKRWWRKGTSARKRKRERDPVYLVQAEALQGYFRWMLAREGLTQAQLADRMGVDRRTVSRLLNRTEPLTEAQVDRYLCAAGATLANFETWNREKESAG